MRRKFIKVLGLSSLGLLAALVTQVHAAGYRLEFQSPSTGAEEGDAAAVEDASTNWYNAAGLPLLPQQVVIGAFDVYAPGTFSGNTRAPNQLSPLLPTFAASGNASSHINAALPLFHYSMPVDKYWSLGFSVVPAWGFREDYGSGSIVRYNLIRVYTKSLDLSPSVGWRVNDHLSFGGGPDFHYLSVLSNFNVNTSGVLGPATFGDSLVHYSADNWGYGAHFGILYQVNQCLRFGLNYRTKITMDLDGYSDFDGAIAGLPEPNFNENPNFKLRLPLPPVTTLSAYWAVSPAWAFTGSLIYEQWSVTKGYYASNFAELDTSTNVALPQAFHNTWDVGLGTRFTLNEAIILRASLKYIAQTPTTTMFRDVSFPDGPKLGLNLGGHFQYNRYVGFDAEIGHVWVKTMGIHSLNPITKATASGESRGNIDFFGGQVVWTLC